MEILVILAFVCGVLAPFVHFLVRRDGAAIHAVAVDAAVFAAGELPRTCCKTGAPAEVGMRVRQRRWLATVAEGIIPLTKAKLNGFHKWKRINRLAKTAAVTLFLAGFPLQAMDLPLWIRPTVVLSMCAAIVTTAVSNLIAHRCLAAPKLERDGSVMLRGVHPAFVVAVQESRRKARPATMADRP